uniref:T4 RNA ligase 1-like N-terminal domain-containing protein n=1 Tax=viral metagenome TaxID=1070528 RepID=A0A6C0ERY3_9ZZZZ
MSLICANLSLIPGFTNLINGENLNESSILKLNKVDCRISTAIGSYKVIRYDKDILTYDMIPTYGLCRSVIVNSRNKVVCFAPPKSISSESFISKYPSKNAHIIAQEFVEGTMINVFWDSNIGLTGGWEITTRNTVGATSKFYKSENAKTFREMFLEASKVNNLYLEQLNPAYCYSFVLQHPDNRIVVPFKTPKLYLISMYSIVNEPDNINVYSLNMEEVQKFDWGATTIGFPKIYEWTTYAELIQTYASMNTSYDILGVVLYNSATGERAKIRNPVYEEVRGLRGNQPKLQYQYLFLRKEGKVSEFLKFYPENKKEFSKFRDQLHLFTNTLYANYVACYIKKEKPLKEFSDQYRTHMFTIHQKFISDLRDKKLFVTNTVVINYVNQLHPSLLMYCLNYHMRKRNVDTIRSEIYDI